MLNRTGEAPAVTAKIYDVLLRRQAVRERLTGAGPRPSWQVTVGSGQGFRAHDESGREAAGIALSAEAVTDVLSAIGPVGSPANVAALVRFVNELPPTLQGLDLHWDETRRLDGSMDDFLRASPEEMTQLGKYLSSIRGNRVSGAPPVRIRTRSLLLNREFPLLPNEDFNFWDWQTPASGHASTYAWIDPATVVGSPVNTWNDFADHRPEQVPAIIMKLLTDPDPVAAAQFVLATDGIAHVQRVNGPAGPLHVVTRDGTHRTHALRILDAPLMAAEVAVAPLPLYLSRSNVGVADMLPGETLTPLWRGLLKRGLITGGLTGDHGDDHTPARLELHHATAEWLLLPAVRSTAISRAYERVYPGALAGVGIPANAISCALAWRQWLQTAASSAASYC